jgi:type I restriction enzyme S subunit
MALLRLDEVQEIGCTPKELQKTALKFGDLLIVEGNGSIDQIGRVALWDGSIPVCSHQNHLIRARTGPRIVPEFLLFWMISPLGRQYIERVASSSSGLHTLSISKVSGLPVPLCSIAEMNEIIARIRSRLRDIASLERETSQSALLLDRLDQANLSKAFRGELVPQDPNDEPASVLLERICAARAEQPKNTRKGRGKTANARVAA